MCCVDRLKPQLVAVIRYKQSPVRRHAKCSNGIGNTKAQIVAAATPQPTTFLNNAVLNAINIGKRTTTTLIVAVGHR